MIKKMNLFKIALPAFALFFLLQPAAVQAFGVNECAASRKGSDLVCTAGDVSITSIAIASGSGGACIAGTTTNYDLDVTVNFATPNRWDVGIFLSNDGLSPQSLSATSCSVGVLPTTAPFMDLDGVPTGNPLDTCGDGNGAINGGTGRGILRMNSVPVLCQARQYSGGKLTVPFVVSWDNQSSPSGGICSSNLDPVPNTVSKCNAPDGTTAAGVALITVDSLVMPTITKTNGISTVSSGMTSVYTVVITNNTGDLLKNAYFTDPAVNYLTVSSVTCSTVGGTCPAPGVVTVANMQGQGIVLPDMPNGATITFSITATVTGNPAEGTTITNTAKVFATAINAAGQTFLGVNLATDTDTVAGPPVLTLKKRVINSAGGSKTPNDFVLTATADAPGTTVVSGASTGTPTVINGTTTEGTAVNAASVPAGSYTLTEAMLSGAPLAGYTQTLSCTGGATVLSASPPMRFNLSGGAATCTLLNSDGIAPTLTINKVTRGANSTVGVGGPFTFNGVSNAAEVVNLAATTTAVGFSGTSSAPFLASSVSVPTGKVTLGAAEVDAVITETLPSTSWVITAASCVDNNGATTGNGTNPFSITFNQTPGTNTITIPAANMKSGADLVCTVTNTRRTLVSSVIAPTQTDTFKLDFYNAAVPVTVTTDTVLPGNGSMGNITPIVNAGSYVLTETDNMGKITNGILSYFCIDGNGQSLGSGSVAWGNPSSVTGPTPIVFPSPSGMTLDYKSLQVTCTLKNATTKPFVITKYTIPTTTDTFSYTHTVTGAGTGDAFSALNTLVGSNNGTTNVFNSADITGTNNRTYTITETVPAAWALTALSCYINGVLQTGGTPPTTPNLPLLNVSDSGFCFFTNSRKPIIRVGKTLSPAGDTFDLSVNGTAVATNVGTVAYTATTLYTLNAASGSVTVKEAVNTVPGGDLSIYATTLTCTEDANSINPNAPILTNQVPTDTVSGGKVTERYSTFNVTAGQSINCTFTNNRKPYLTVAKTIAANGGVTRVNATDEFTVSISNGGYSATTASPALSVTTATQGKFSGIAGLSYTLKEVGVPGTDLTKYTSSYVCLNNAAAYLSGSGTSVTFTPGVGDDIVCTFTNTPKSPALILTKTTSGDSGSGFVFTLSNPAVTSGSIATVAADTPVTVGTYAPAAGLPVTITESTIPAGWKLTGAGCSGLNGADTVDTSNLLTGHYIIIPGTSMISGANVQCNFTNTKLSAITVKKVIQGGTGSERFDLRINNVSMDPDGANTAGNFADNDINSATPVYVTPGSAVIVSEFVTAGPALGNYTTIVNCPGTSISNQVYNPASPPAFIPSAGQTITCTFTNSLQPKLTLIKRVVGYSNANDSFDIDIVGVSPIVNVGAIDGYGSTLTYQVAPGTYTFREASTSMANYTTAYSCINANAGGTANASGTLTGTSPRSFPLTPTYNDQFTCTITNTSTTATISLTKKLATTRFASTDQFTVQIKEAGAVVNSTTNSTTSGTGTVTNDTSPNLGTTGTYTATAGNTYELTEIAAGTPLTDLTKYDTFLNCINNGVVMSSPSLNGSSPINLTNPPTVTPAAGDVIVCTMTNTTTITAYNDFGDAPSNGTVVDTVARNYGSAGHIVPASPAVYLGTTAPDKETTTLQSTWQAQTTATGDDSSGTADEGIAQLLSGAPASFPALSAGASSYSLTLVCAGNGAAVAGWIDFNNNGTFDSGERQAGTCSSGLVTLNWTGLTDLKTGSSFVRFRIAGASGDVTNPIGIAGDGEVEDYPINIRPGVKIIKTLVPAADSGKFNLSVSGGNPATPAGSSNPLNDAVNSGTTGFIAVDAAGSITVQEVAGTGTDLANYTTTLNCTLGDGTTAVTLTGSTLTGATRTGAFTAPAEHSVGTAAQVICTFTNTVIAAGVNVTGRVYSDSNQNGIMDSGEDWTGGPTVYAKLFAGACPAAGTASSVQTLISPAGTYTFTSVAAGSYCIVLSSNATATETTPSVPAGWFNAMPSSGNINLTVTNVDVPNQNFGLFSGSRLTGRVFNDNGTGGGTANDGIQNGAEVGIVGVTVTANQAGCPGTLCATAVTDGSGDYVMWLPSTVIGAVTVTEINLSGYLSTGGQIGNTGGAYTRSTDTTAFSVVAGTNYSGVNFADVPDNQFLTDGVQTALPGTVVFYPHTFIAGTGGAVSFSLSRVSSPAVSGWSEVVYQDSNCNAVIDGGEPVVPASVAVTAGQTLCLLVKEFVPAAAPVNAQNMVTVTAAFNATFSGSGVSFNYLRHDTTTVGQPTSAGLSLNKSVDKTAAMPGDNLTYTITYKNQSSDALSNIIFFDYTPSYTTFLSASCGAPLPLNISACNASTQPAVGGTGAIQWTLTGTLASGASGSVTYTVKVDN